MRGEGVLIEADHPHCAARDRMDPDMMQASTHKEDS